MSQNNRVLAALQRAGSRGITQIDFDLPNVIDGGKPIKRIAARVYELRKGFEIREDGWRQKCRVYVYAGALGAVQATSDPVPGRDGRAVVASASPAASPDALFEQPPAPAANDMWKAA